jgi:hypothetical protein
VDGENFPQLPLIFLQLRLSENGCCHGLPLPILQGHPVLCSIYCLATKTIVRSGLMFEGRYFKARQNLLQKMKDNHDKNNPLLCYTVSDNSSSTARHDNMNHGKAKEELEEFERFKHKKYQPKVREVTVRCLTGELCQIMVGPVDKKGILGHNLFDYIDVQGCIDFVQIFSDHSKLFPTLWIIAQHESFRHVVEVGCERFFVYLGTCCCLDEQD